MLKKAKKAKKSSKKGKKSAKVVKKGTKLFLKNGKVTMSGKRHFEALAKLAKDHQMRVFDILSAIRGPDTENEKYSAYKEKYTGVIRTWLFGTEGCGGMVQSQEAPVTARGWEKLEEEVLGGMDARVSRDHYLGHIHTACYAIAALYRGSIIFKEGT
jgi:hypothetical protein